MRSNVYILRPVRERYYINSGSPDRDLYILDGDHLIKSGVENQQAIIDSYADSTDIQLIVKRITEEEYDRLVNSRKVYMDTTVMPQTIADIKNQYRESLSMFNDLPEVVKSDLGGSFSKFVKMSDKDFEKFIISHSVKEAPVSKESEVVENGI